MQVTWKDIKNNIDDCVTICEKDGMMIFRIIESRYGYYADYYDNLLFRTPSLTYHEADILAKEKIGNDSVDTRLEIVKEFFLEDYKEQVFNRALQVERIII